IPQALQGGRAVPKDVIAEGIAARVQRIEFPNDRLDKQNRLISRNARRSQARHKQLSQREEPVAVGRPCASISRELTKSDNEVFQCQFDVLAPAVQVGEDQQILIVASGLHVRGDNLSGAPEAAAARYGSPRLHPTQATCCQSVPEAS